MYLKWHVPICVNATLFDVGGVEIHSIECIEYCTKDQSNVEDVEDRSNTPKGCNAMYVKDVEDRSNTPKGCNAMLCMLKMSKMHSIKCIEYYRKDQSNVEDLEYRSKRLKGCDAMYVRDVPPWEKIIHTHSGIITSLILNEIFNPKKAVES